MKLYLSEEQHKDYFGDFIDTEKTKRIKDANKAYNDLLKLLDGNTFYNEISKYGVDEGEYKTTRNTMLQKLNDLIPVIKKESYVLEKLTLFDFASSQDDMRDLIRTILVAMYGVNETKTKECVKVVNNFFDVINKDFYKSNGYTDDKYEKGVHFTEKEIQMMSNNY